jgi:hypothetical protein
MWTSTRADIVLFLIHQNGLQQTPHNNLRCESHQLSILSNSSAGGIGGSGGPSIGGGTGGAGGNAEGPQFNMSGANIGSLAVHGGKSL